MLFWGAALAAPLVEAHGSATITDHGAAGLGGFLALASDRVEGGLELDALAHAGGLGLLAGPRLRLHGGAIDAPARAHLVLGGGYAVGLGTGPFGEGGVGLDVGDGPRPLRLGVAYQRGIDQPGRALFTVGLVGRSRPPAPAPVAPPAFDAAMVWVPGPVCAWMPPDAAGDAWTRPDLDAARATLIPVPPSASGTGDGEAPTGDLVIAALPGDQVWVDDQPLTPAADGVAWQARPEGRATVRVVGGGRRHEDTVAIAASGTLWYAADPPAGPVRVRFSAGSSTPPTDLEDQLRPLVTDLGDWTVQVWGSASPEGDEQGNADLATARADALARALAALGVDPSRIERLPPRPPGAELDLPDQRAAVVQPRLESP